ncbi:hypothetical protein EW145_g1547 [Phellinidium pouzarii]|uniref:F-box domain-containing protein n=1 Tax=Phellinidium pouzarii TaxID=167371 RepID=A0A4S4LE40_9AGAM|nr:hypothetical protein EW145_g1547 [Phellinidium pouzarii]
MLNAKTLLASMELLAGLSEENGSMNMDYIWADLYIHIESNLANICAENAADALSDALSDARKLQERSNSILRILIALIESLEGKIKTFTERVSQSVLHFGLDKLPYELLSLVLGYASTTFDEALKLSHVCSRFRSVMLSSPHVWNHEIGIHMNSERVTAILARSGDLPLKVKVSMPLFHHESHLSETAQNNLENTLLQSGRITELDFSDMSIDLSEQIINLFPSVQLPALRKLSVDRHFIDDPFPHFYASWVLANLKQLEVTNFVPRPNLATNLILGLYYIRRAETGQDSARFPLITNTSVVSFHLHVSKGSASVPWTTNCIRLSNVTDMTMNISNKATLPFLFDVPMLKTLMIEVVDSFGYLHFETILGYAPRYLTKLLLMAPHSILTMNWEDALEWGGFDRQRPVLPPLRTLRFSDCGRIDQDFLEAVRSTFLENDVEIGRVEVLGCEGADEQILRDVFPNSVVHWIY